MPTTTPHSNYIWHERWAALPDNPSARENGRTHGVAVTSSGGVIVFAQCEPAVLRYSPAGKLVDAWGDRFAGAHGLTLVRENGSEFLWLTDQYSGEVVKTTLEGETVLNIPPPQVEGTYSPTWVAVHPRSGDIWVADGYGTNIVRRYTAAGEPVAEITGEEGPGRFARPHGIAFSPDGELWITDRRNKRIAVYDAEGRYLRHRDGAAHSPCMFDFHNGHVYVPELFGSVKILDHGMGLVAEVGANPAVRPPGGWPDQEGWGWPTLEGWPDLNGTPHVQAGRFNSPHGLAVAPDGSIYVVEWIVGGRITKLEPQV